MAVEKTKQKPPRSVKLDDDTDLRLAKKAKRLKRTEHYLMVEAIKNSVKGIRI